MNYLDAIKELNKTINAENKKIKRDQKIKSFNKIQRLSESRNFRIVKQYKNKVGLEAIDEFFIHSYETAINIIEMYRKSGHLIGLHCIGIYLNDEKIQRIKFI